MKPSELRVSIITKEANKERENLCYEIRISI